MSDQALENLTAYVTDLKRHTEGRRALHCRLSALEKPYRESYYRRQLGAAVKPLIEKFHGRSFALSNADLFLIVQDAGDDDFAQLLADIQRVFKESGIFGSLDPAVSISDAFFTWFDLEEQYGALQAHLKLIESGAEIRPASAPVIPEVKAEGPDEAGVIKLIKPKQDLPPPTLPNRKVRYIQIRPKKQDKVLKDLDPEMLMRLTNAIKGASLEPYHHHQQIMAMLPGKPETQIMTHQFIPVGTVLAALLGDTELYPNRWFYRYLEDILSERLLASQPQIPRPGDLAGSIRVTGNTLLSEAFDAFDKAVQNTGRSKVILEFSIHEVMQDYSLFLEAAERVSSLGYRYSVADIDIRAISWLDLSGLNASFLKLLMPSGGLSDWLTDDLRKNLPGAIRGVGLGRVIMADADSQSQIELGQEWGITLFQGAAASKAKAS